ncbi:MAG: hypothetical protein V3U52_01000 [Thermoplasmata archaeon]
MIGHRQIAGGALLILAILGLFLWYNAVGSYLAINDARLNLPQHVSIVEVEVPELTSAESRATVGVLVRIENPSAAPIIVFRITYEFYMDNLTDTRPFWEKHEDIYVGPGGFYEAEGGFEVPAGGVRWIWANLTVDDDVRPHSLERLNTSFNGRYYPIVLGALQYRFPGTNIVESVRSLTFSTPMGVIPHED